MALDPNMNTSLVRKYPQLLSDPQFMQIYQQLYDLARGPASGRWALNAANTNTNLGDLSDAATARARQLGLPADRMVWTDGSDQSIHKQRNDVLKGLAIGGTMLAGGALANGAISGIGAGAAAAPAASGASAALPASLPVTVGGLPAGASTIGAIGGGIAAPAGTAATTGLTTAGVLSKAAPLLKAAGAGIGNATNAAANNRGVESDYNLNAYREGNTAQSQIENELMQRAATEAAQRKNDLGNIYRQSVAHNPSHSIYDKQGPPPISQQYLDAIDALSKQGGAALQRAPAYDVANLPMRTYTPPPPMKKAGTLEQAGNWLGPTLTLASAYLGGR